MTYEHKTGTRQVRSYRKYPIVVVECTVASQATTICEADIEACRNHPEHAFTGQTDQDFMDYVGELFTSLQRQDIDYENLPEPVAELYYHLVDSPVWEKVDERVGDDFYTSVVCDSVDGKRTGDSVIVDKRF